MIGTRRVLVSRVLRSMPAPHLVVIALFAVSAGVRFGVSLSLKGPWIAPDEMLYGMLGRSFWTTGQMHVLGSEPFYGFYPLLVGLPLAAFGPAAGLVVVKALQAVVMSSTVVIVYAWARQLAGPRWALAAAAMTASLPALAYSGLMMTESVRLPADMLALWVCSRALAAPSWRNQALAAGAVTVAVAIRLQSLALFPAFALALVLFAGFERDVRHLRRFLPLVGLSAAGLVVLELGRLAVQHGGTVAYGTSGVGKFRLGGLISWSFRLLGDLYLLVVGLPLLALVALLVARLRDRRSDRDLSALLAIALGYVTASVLEIGAFISIYSDRLQERYEIALPPLLFVVMAVWLARGMPRPQPFTLAASLVVVAPALLLPVRQVVTSGAMPDSFMLVPLLDLARWTSRETMVLAWIVGVLLIAVLALALPRSSAPWVAGLVVVCLAGASVQAQRSIESAASFSRWDFFGTSSPQWTAHAATGPIVYLDDGDPLFTDIMQQLYWNPRIRTLGLLPGKQRKEQAQLPEGVPVSVRADGLIVRRPGGPFAERLAIAPSGLTLLGRPIARLDQGRDEPGLVLWRTSGAPRVSLRLNGLSPDGSIDGTVRVTVYGCKPGALALAVSTPDKTARLTVSVRRLKSVSALITRGGAHRLWVPAPKGADGHGACLFYLAPVGQLVVGRIAFEPGTSSVPADVPLHHVGKGTTEVAFDGKVGPAQTAAGSTYAIHAGYCLNGQFVELDYNQAKTDPRYKGAVYANFIRGVGLTCSAPPPGYHRHGFATAAMGVPAGIYPYYAP